MSRSPVQSFTDLTAALTSMCELHDQMQTDDQGQDRNLITRWDAQADRAMVAFQELVVKEDALRDITALLAATYGGEAA